MPANYMVSWYEPWKTEHSVNGVPVIPHKALADDTFRQLYPFKTLASGSMLAGQLPLWNPYNGAGQPLLATLHPGFFNPLSVMLHMNNDAKAGWAWYVMLHVPLVLISVYAYARSLRLSKYASVVTAVTTALSGAVVVRYIFGEFLFSYAMLPILLLVQEQMRDGKRRAILFVPFVTTLVLISVQPQISAYIFVTAIIYAMVRIRTRAFLYFAMMGLGVGMSSFQLIPSWELFRNANVTAGSSAFIFEKFLMPLSHLITIIIPNYFGNQGTYNFWGKTDYTETVASIGSIPIYFVMISIAVRNIPKHLISLRRFFLTGVLATIALTLNWWLPKVISTYPIPVVSTSIPTRIYLFTSFFLAVLAGMGVDIWFQNTKDTKRTGLRAIVSVGLFLAVVCIGTWYARASGHIVCPVSIPACATVALRNSAAETLVFVLSSIAICIPLCIRFRPIRLLSYGALVLLLAATGIYNAWKFLPFSPPEYVGAPHPILTALSAFSPQRTAGLGSAAFATDFATQYRYFDTNYYDPLYIRRYGELVSYVNTGNREKGLTRSDVNVVSDATVSAELALRRERFWDMTGTSALVTKKSEDIPFAGNIVWEDANWRVTSRDTALPRAYLVTDVRTDPDPNHMLAALFSVSTDIGKTAYVEVPVTGVDVGSPVHGSVTIDSYMPNSVVLSAQSDTNALFVLSDTYYPGWRATIDGKKTPVYRANYAFRAIVLPQGSHRVVVSYEPESVMIGLWTTIVSFIVWILLYVFFKRE